MEEGRLLHVVAIPYPLQGHVTPMLQLCNLLVGRGGVRITFVHLHSNLSRLHLSSSNPHISHISLPHSSLPATFSSSPSSIRARVLASETLLDPFLLLLAGLHAKSRVSCIIADVLTSWAHTAGSQLGILGAALWTGALSSFASYCNIPLLASKGFFPIKDIDGGSQQIVTCIPGLPQIFTFADLPSFFQTPTWPDDVMDFIIRQITLMGSARWIFSNSAPLEFERELEEEMRTEMPLLSIGPLLALDERHLLGAQVGTQSIGAPLRASLWQEDLTCLEWLKGRPPSSVLYVSFGSVALLPSKQIREIAEGLEASQHSFLWALRPDSIEGKDDLSSILHGIQNRGLVFSWVPQLEILAHDSIGGFLTHCGWNSVMESIAMGKPMLGLPWFAEQKMNCRLIEQWHVGRQLQFDKDGLVDRQEVEAQVRYIMGSHDNSILRRRCIELQIHLLSALSNEEGSSFKNIVKFLSELHETVSSCQIPK